MKTLLVLFSFANAQAGTLTLDAHKVSCVYDDGQRSHSTPLGGWTSQDVPATFEVMFDYSTKCVPDFFGTCLRANKPIFQRSGWDASELQSEYESCRASVNQAQAAGRKVTLDTQSGELGLQ
jgi:hypothetical protein